MSLEALGRLFYLISPNKTSFQTVEEVPNYIGSVYPDLVVLFLLEICISKCLRKSDIRINDTVACLSQGILFELISIFIPGGRAALYVYVHYKWGIVDLPWNGLSTWCISFLLVDFAYYWLHRSAHTFNFLWATHQVHHSSEDFNISTNVRQSILQHFLWVLYLPLALILPVPAFMVHTQFNYIYQFWIHTSLIKSLGPLEYILNTPSHHRVHHGANKNFIDKNFGGTLIIWDKLFGTFATEKEEVVYGLTHNLQTFDIIQIQFSHCIDMWKKMRDYKGWKNKISVLIKGPGWAPGKPWTGDANDIPETKAPVKKYDPPIPKWCQIYVVWHFILFIQGYNNVMDSHMDLPRGVLYLILFFLMFSMISLGVFLDRSVYAASFELNRCLLYFLIDWSLIYFTDFSLTIMFTWWFGALYVRTTFIASALFWMCYIMHTV